MSNELILPKKTVDDYLNEVDYTGINTYVPSQFALDLVNLIKLIEGGEPENKTPPVHYKFIDTLVTEGDTVNMCHRGFAKALSLDTKVFTDTGITTIKDIKVGDTIFGEDGKLTTITHKSEVFNKPMYRLTLSDGRTLDVSEDHINVILHKRQKRVNGKRVNYVERQEVTTKELLKIKLSSTRTKTKKNPLGKENLVWIPTIAPITFSEKDLPLDPYTVGLLLGDGCLTSSVRFCSHVNDFEFYKTKVPYDWGASNLKGNTLTVGIKGISKEVKSLGLNCHGNFKRVPAKYLYGSIHQRLELLKGLMDTDGTVYKNGACSFTSNSKGLVEDVMFLVRSLGGVATISSTGKAWRTHVSLNMSMFGLPRKAERQNLNSKTKVALESIELIEQVPSQCIAVDNALHTFIAGDFVVTHNTTVKEYLMWYIAIFGSLPGIGKIPYALYVSDSMDNGVKKMRRSMEGRWDNSPFLQKYVPKAKFTDIIWDFTNASGNRFVVTGHGAQTGVRGTRENNSRPVLALLDDLISDTDAKSPTVIQNVKDTIYKAIFAALHPKKRKIIWSGTPFNASDPLYLAVESGAWNVNVFPVCERFPCSKEEFRGSWEDRFTYESVSSSYNLLSGSGNLEAFNQELMLRIMSEDDKLIEEVDIQWYDHTLLMKNLQSYNIYITTDFATSEKTSADFSVISVWAINNKGHWFWIDGICKRQQMDANLDDLFRLVQIYNPLSVGIEVSGQQGGFVSLIQRAMIDKNIFFNLASESNNGKPGIRPNKQKFTRFLTILPWFKSKIMFFPEQKKDSAPMQEAMNELGLVSKHGFKSKHDDFIDTISMLSLMNAWRPTADIQMKYNDTSGLWEEDSYEEEVTGLSSYIV